MSISYRSKPISICKTLFISGIFLTLIGCAHQRFEFHPNPGTNDNGPITQKFWFAGLNQTQTINAATTCGGAEKITSIEVSTSLSQLALSIFSLGLYSPREVNIRCLK